MGNLTNNGVRQHMSVKNKYYFCLHFNLRIFLKIILTAVFSKHNVVIYYVLDGKSLGFINRTRKLKLFSFLRRISVEKIPYEASRMTTSDGRSATEASYYDSLYGIVKNIEDKCLENEGSIFSHLSKKLTEHKGDIKFWVKHHASFSIIDQALLVDIASWLMTHQSSPLLGEEISVIIDRKNYGSCFIVDYAYSKKLSVMRFHSGRKMNENLVFLFCYNLWRLVSGCFSPFNSALNGEKNKEGKVCTYHYGDKSISNVRSKRNHSLFWHPDSGIRPDDILIFSQKSNDIDAGEIQETKKNGFHLIACDGPRRKSSKLIGKHKCSLKSLKYFFEYSIEGMKLLLRANNSYDYEVAKISLLLLLNLPYWEDFFKENNVKVLFKPGVLFSWMDVAAKFADSAVISFQYSNLSKTMMGHLECSDAFFVWGKEYENVYRNGHTRVGNFIQSGYIFDYTFDSLSDTTLTLCESFKEKGVDFILSLFDENLGKGVLIGSIGIKKYIVDLYRQIFCYAVDNKKIGLVAKPKLDSNIDVLRSHKDISESMDLLEREGRLKFLNSERFPIEAGRVSDLAVGMVSSSTAALECSFAGIPAVTFNLDGSGLSSKEDVSGKDRIVFDDFAVLAKCIEQLRENKPAPDGFADWSSFLNSRDPFRDGKAYLRIGYYIKNVFENMNNGLKKDVAVRAANKAYSVLYGEDKILCNPSGGSCEGKEESSVQAC